MAIDPAGNAYLTGETYDRSNTASSEVILAKYNPDGTHAWIKRLSAPGNGLNIAYSIDVNASSQICLAGSTDGTFDSTTPRRGRGFIARYTTEGQLIWSKHSLHPAIAVQLDSLGNCYLLSLQGIEKFTPDGKALWNIPSRTQAIVITQKDKLYSLDYNKDSFAPVLNKIDHRGNKTLITDLSLGQNFEWTQVVLSNLSIESGPTGGLYIQGTISGLDRKGVQHIDSYASKSDLDGTLRWEHHQGRDGYRHDTFDITVDYQGNAYIIGTVMPTPVAGQRDIVLMSYTADGTLVWLKNLGTPLFDAAVVIGIDQRGNYYIAGATEGNLDKQDNPDHQHATPFVARNKP
jgi:outer membrane protein assembly factor BamB